MANNITLALNIISTYDWDWRYDDGYGVCAKARNTMRTFVELAAKCETAICNALRELWVLTYDYNHNIIAAEDYKTRKSELMEIINPATMALAA